MHTEHKSCILCGAESLEKLPRYSASYLVKCRKCSFVFCKKIPSSTELENHYNSYGRNDYLSPVTIKRYEELLDSFEPYKKTGRILDVGCGIGYFLEVAKNKGWEVYGTEYTARAMEICENKGIKMFKGALCNIRFADDFFDVITSFEVIEHINNPNEDVARAKKILRTGGIIYLTTPNFNSINRYILKEKDNVICYPEHLSYYTPGTILHLFGKYNFSTIKIQTTGFSRTRYRNSMKISNQPQISAVSDDELIRGKLEKSPLLRILKNTANSLLTLTKSGDSLKAMFQKET